MFAPDDVVARRVLPTLRSMVARRLAAQELTEREVAERLGLTQGAVSKYLRGRGRAEPAVEHSAAFSRLADNLAARLRHGPVSPIETTGETLAVIRKEESRGVVCALHEEEVPALRGLGCDLCVREGISDLILEQEALGDLRGALRALERNSAFARLIPSVGSNLARATRGAESPLEVAAVPGRIFEMAGRVRVAGAPEFGASKHVAEVVLAAKRVFPEQLAALNVRADTETLAAAASLRWSVLEFDATHEGRSDRIAKALRGRRRAPRAVYHRGAFGIEPIMYVLGRSAGEVVGEASKLAAALGPSA